MVSKICLFQMIDEELTVNIEIHITLLLFMIPQSSKSQTSVSSSAQIQRLHETFETTNVRDRSLKEDMSTTLKYEKYLGTIHSFLIFKNINKLFVCV